MIRFICLFTLTKNIFFNYLVRGCPSAVVRVWNDKSKPVIELCGANLSNDTRQIISSSNTLKVS